MANFTYHTRDKTGEDHNGDIQAADLVTAAALLRKKGFVIISVKAKSPPATKVIDNMLNQVKFSDLVVMTRQLATMVSAGLVLSESIDILEEQQSNKLFKEALQDISRNIKGGLTLAQAMGRHPEVFPKLYINLVKSGEASGKLDQVLLQMADGLEKDREFKARIKGALIYPVVVVIMMVAVVIIMMIFVIPRLTSLYSQSTMELPLPTKILIATSGAFVNYWWLMLVVAVFGFVGFKRWIKTPDGDYVYSIFILKVPIIGKLISNVELTNFNRTFGLLTSAGIPLLEAISIVQDQMQNAVYRKTLKDGYIGVEKGLSFSSLLTSSVYPKIISQMVRVGEETGKVDEIFFKMADYFESESDHLVKNLTVAIEPIILVVLGVGVAFLVLSIILPIYQLTTSF